MKLKTLKDKLVSEIFESIKELNYDVIDKIDQEELALQLICVIDEYSKSKIKDKLIYLKHVFYAAGGEDVEEYIDKLLKE